MSRFSLAVAGWAFSGLLLLLGPSCQSLPTPLALPDWLPFPGTAETEGDFVRLSVPERGDVWMAAKDVRRDPDGVFVRRGAMASRDRPSPGTDGPRPPPPPPPLPSPQPPYLSQVRLDDAPPPSCGAALGPTEECGGCSTCLGPLRYCCSSQRFVAFCLRLHELQAADCPHP